MAAAVGKLRDYGANKALTTGITSMTLVVGLAKAAIADDTALGEITEAAYTNYARQSITFDTPEAMTTYRGIKNASAITFPQSGSTETGITHWFVTDSTGIVASGELADADGNAYSLSVDNTSVPTFADEVFIIKID